VFELATPYALMLLPLPLILWVILPQAKANQEHALRVPFFQFFENSKHNKSNVSHMKSLSWFLLIWLLLVFALSGPRTVGHPQVFKHESHNIMLLLDISGSMEIRDRMEGNAVHTRLDIVKSAAKTFVKDRSYDQIGLILFGTRAYLQTPLTADHNAVLMRLDDASVGLAGKTTSIGDALGLAIKHMQKIPKAGRVIILLTDGANNSGALLPLKAAKIAKKDDIKVYTIGLSSRDNLPLFGQAAMVDDLDEHTLEQIADITGGMYFHATDMASLKKTYAKINQLETTPQPKASVRPIKEYYYYPLAMALIMLSLWLMMRVKP